MPIPSTGMNTIGVSCGTCPAATDRYIRLACEFGETLARRGSGLIYSAGGIGPMKALAETAFMSGARVIGVLPLHLYELQESGKDPGEVYVVRSMHECKRLIYRLSTAIAVLPGGLETLDELIEVATWNQLGIHDKPMVLLNIDDFFDPLLAQLDRMVADDFLQPVQRAAIRTAADTETALDLLECMAGSQDAWPGRAMNPAELTAGSARR